MAGEAGTAAVIQSGGGGGFASSIPGGTRTLVIGGAALAAGLFVLLKGKGSGASPSDPASGGRLDSSANIALGQVAYEQRKAAGEESIRDQQLLGAVQGAGASSHAQGLQIIQLIDQLRGLGFNIRAYQDYYAANPTLHNGLAASPPVTLNDGPDGGALGAADVAAETLIGG